MTDAIENTVTVPEQTKQEIAEVQHDVVRRAGEIVVSSNDEYEAATEFLRNVKGRVKELEDKRKSMTKPLDEAKQRIMDLFRPVTDAGKEAEQIVKKKMASYADGQERIRREAEARAAEKALKEQERLEARAEKYAEKGNIEKAEALQEQAATVHADVQAPEAPKAQGAHTRKVYKAEVTDMEALIKAAANGDSTAASLLVVDESRANKLAGALKDAFNIPGLKLITKTQVVAR